MIINEVIQERYGKKAGTKEALSVYQKVVQQVVKNLMEEEWDEAEYTAAKWNLDCGPPNEVKARNAARYGQKVFCKFAQEMWRACGMQVVIMAGWKQEDSNTDNKCYYPSQQSGTSNLNNGSVMHQTSAATSSTPVDPPKTR
ncbi:hypothetical protein PAXRUDRAFT_16604 [Paxillus rubicundulus Ve08.2h10]|uniref:Uncharacterized protein n=1 Tax=Paxillus rubicundulus Ve08.2h10 TaxID=930991 RepID=A0A0D0CU64_9AGAM|nr:hypothetical protein PAXRUDRAFT_16604 [Paxillus rubicundulus Ve08.2h10]